MKDAFYIINYTYFICIGILLCLGTIFFPGSYNELKVSLANPYFGVVLSHIFVNIGIILLFLTFMFLISFFCNKWVPFRERLKFYGKTFLGLTVLAIVLVLATYFMH